MTSIFDHGGNDLPQRTLYRAIRDAGFDAVLLWQNANRDNYSYRDAAELARAAGLIVENIHAAPFGGANTLWHDGAAGDDYIKILTGGIDDCADFGVPALVIHITHCKDQPPPNDIGLDRLLRVVDYAERKCINLAVENTGENEYIAFAFNHIDSSRLGYCFDSGHANVWTPGEDVLGMFGHRLMALHLHDNHAVRGGPGDGDEHRLPFDGIIDWPRAMRAIAGHGYAGYTTLEASNNGYEHLPMEKFLRIAYERAAQLDGMRNT